MATELDVKNSKGFVTIALIGVAAAVVLAVVVEWVIPTVRTKLKI